MVECYTILKTADSLLERYKEEWCLEDVDGAETLIAEIFWKEALLSFKKTTTDK